MSEKSEALRLAGVLTAATEQTDAEDDVIHVARWFVEDAAAELRRLYVENKRFAALVCEYASEEAPDAIRKIAVDRDRWHTKAQRAEAQRDALLEALKYHQEQTRPIQRTLDVIKAVEEGK